MTVAGAGPGFAPLRGKVVVDFSTMFPGPYAGLLLAQLGARVVKVEPPTGDPARAMNPGGFTLLNAGKESVAVDVKHPDAAPVVRGLVELADAALVSSLPRTLARLGLDAATLQAVNPGLVYCAVLGWSGPLRDQPAHDIDIFAGTGAVALTPDIEYPLGLPFADLGAGALAAVQVAAALAAPPSPAAPVLEVSMASVLQTWVTLASRATTEEALRGEPHGPVRIGGYGIFAGSDGRRFSIGAVEDRFWRAVVKLCDLPVGFAELTLPERRVRAAEINDLLGAQVAGADAGTWVRRLRDAGVPAAPVATPAEAIAPGAGGDAVHVVDGRIALAMPSGHAPGPWTPAPELGQHTAAVVGELGLADRIDALRAARVIP